MDHVLADERKASGTMVHLLTDYEVMSLSTSRPPKRELWAILEYYLINKSVSDLFRSKGILDRDTLKKVGHEFQSYIIQARNFYEYAENSDTRSSALLYYYSFLNLAKAKLLAANPTLQGARFIHGVKRVIATGDLGKLTLRAEKANATTRVSTFQALYKARFGKEISDAVYLKVLDLLSYITDISAEYTKVVNKDSRTSTVKFLTAIDEDRKKSWAKIAISNPERILDYQKECKNFFNEFTEIKVGSLSRQFNFELGPGAARYYRFFEGRTEFDYIGNSNIDVQATMSLMKSIFSPFYQMEVHDSSASFQLVAPLRSYDVASNKSRSRVQIDEMMAAYLVMFHLSEIVRYEPYYIDKLLSKDTKEGWLLTSFIESVSYTFLLRMTSWITETHYFVKPR